jgi:hypothetical protein
MASSNNPRDHVDKARDALSTAADKGREAASAVGGAVSQAASAVGRAADSATQSAGSGMRNLGETIREHSPQGGVLGTPAQAVASGLEKGGHYLEKEGLSGMMDDVTDLIRRNPVPALLIGIGIGFLIGRTLGS